MRAISALFLIFGLDLTTKRWVDKKLPLHRKKEIVKNHLYFWHIKNSGIAYHKFSGKRNGILISTGMMLLLYMNYFLQILLGKKEKCFALPLAMILGGGLGNFWERLTKGRVTDFLFIPFREKNTPIFNLADMFILFGTIGMTIISCGKCKKNENNCCRTRTNVV